MHSEVGISEVPQELHAPLADIIPQSVDVDRFKAVPAHAGNLQHVIERYRDIPQKCPYLQSMGAAGIELVQKLAAAETNSERGPTMREMMEARKNKSQNLEFLSESPKLVKKVDQPVTLSRTRTPDVQSDTTLPQTVIPEYLIARQRGATITTEAAKLAPPSTSTENELGNRPAERIKDRVLNHIGQSAESSDIQIATSSDEQSIAEIEQRALQFTSGSNTSAIDTAVAMHSQLRYKLAPKAESSFPSLHKYGGEPETRQTPSLVHEPLILKREFKVPFDTATTRKSTLDEHLVAVALSGADKPAAVRLEATTSQLRAEIEMISNAAEKLVLDFDMPLADTELQYSEVTDINISQELDRISNENIKISNASEDDMETEAYLGGSYTIFPSAAASSAVKPRLETSANSPLQEVTEAVSIHEELRAYVQSHGPAKSEAIQTALNSVVDAVRHNQELLSVETDEVEQPIEEIEQPAIQLLESSGLDSAEEFVTSLAQRVMTSEVRSRIADENQLFFNELNHLGSWEYKSSSIISLTARLLYMLKQKTQPHIRLGTYALSGSLSY